MERASTSTANNPILTTMPSGRKYEAKYSYDEWMDNTEYHCHDFFEFYVHIHGGQYMGLDNNMYALKPNQIFIIPPFCMHGLSATSALQDYRRGYLNLAPDMLRTLGCGQIDLDSFFRSYTSQGQFTFQLLPQDAEACVDLMQRLNTPRRDDVLENFRNCGYLIEFLHRVCQALRQAHPVTSSVLPNSIIQEVLAYINSNYTQQLKTEQLAKRFGISVSYLSHEFQKFTNRSVYDYILYRRVMLARQMMNSDLSLNAIAYQCGFNDYSNFLRMFRKLVGVSPSYFRKNYASSGDTFSLPYPIRSDAENK